MAKFRSYAENLVIEYKKKRAMILSKRRKLTMNNEEDSIKKVLNYKKGLEYISKSLIDALEQYNEVLNSSVPESQCSMQVKNKFPNDIDITFIIKNHKMRFLTRTSRKGEEFQNVLVDGMLYVESSYQGGDRRMETQVGLWSDIGENAWGLMNENDDFIYFMKDILPDLIKPLWDRATLALVHAH